MLLAAATTGRQQRRAALAVLALASLAASCVTTYETIDPENDVESLPFAVPVAIPMPELGGGGNSRVLVEFYSGILRRLQDAADEGDVALLDGLVDSYDRPNVPKAFQEHLQGYRAIARGIGFQHHISQQGRLRLLGEVAPGAEEPKTPVLGQPLRLELEVPPMATPIQLGALGERDPIGFSVAVTIDDEYVDGSSRRSQTKDFLWLPKAFDLSGTNTLRLPIEVGADVGDAVRRSVLVRVDLMPGYVTFDEVRAPVQRVTAGAVSYTQWPEGHEILAEQPLAGLRAALKDFTPKNFASAYLSALLVPSKDRRQACALLIDQVRFGRADQARVAMAALHEIAGVNIAVGDRDGWLGWWQSRQ